MPTCAAYTLCFLHDSERVLLIDRATDRVELPGLLNGLGGKLHPGEDLAAAARREIREEAGVIATELRFRGTESWVCRDGHGAVKDQGTLYLFTSTRWQGAIAASCPEGQLRWLPVVEALQHPRLVPNLPTILSALLSWPPRMYCGMAHYRSEPDATYRLVDHTWTSW